MISEFIKVVGFAAEKHKTQRRKDVESSPYINHPIALAKALANEGGIVAHDVLCAAVLHDTIEDTNTTADELSRLFGDKITSIVLEVSDDKNINDKAVRKLLQIEHAAHLSHEAKLVKLADKICNLRDILSSPPANWDVKRKLEYFKWAELVVAGVRGTNLALELIFDSLLNEGKKRLITTSNSFRVESYDSSDSPDERSPIFQGDFATYEEALSFSKRMVEEFIRNQIEIGNSPENAARAFRFGAEVPMIFVKPEGVEYFQPFEYADHIAIEIFSKNN